MDLLDHLDALAPALCAGDLVRTGLGQQAFRSAPTWRSRFRGVVTRDDVVNGKPHPEPYLKASTALGYSPADVLAIEDSPTGLRSAHAAGLMAILAPDLIQPDDEARGLALHVVTSLDDVREMLRHR